MRIVRWVWLLAAWSACAHGPMTSPTKDMQEVLGAHLALGGKPVHLLTPEQARRGPSAKDGAEAVQAKREGRLPSPEPVASVRDVRLPGPGKPLDARVYTPSGAGPFPAIVYFHGGGFVLADRDVYDNTPRALANALDAVVVSSDYRLAPENPYPASHDDAQAAFRYVSAHPDEFNINPRRIAIAGESAGANLATVVAMRQKRDGGAMPVFQLLVYPFLSNDLSTPSHRKNGHGLFFIGNADIEWFWRHELGADWRSNRDPLALPIYATADQLRGLPPAHVVVAALDPLLDEGTQYATMLRSAGVPVTIQQYDGVTHEFFGMAAVVPQAKQAQTDATQALRSALGGAR